MRKYGSDDFLLEWWNNKKADCHENLDRAAESLLREIHNWTYTTRDGERSLFTVKAFWIPRELHANNIWRDFPMEYCCVPDSYVKDVLFELYGRQVYKDLFGVSYSNQCFNLDASILMSKKVCELVSMNRIDGYYHYDLPIFRKGYLQK
jgi:hypothetical protein